MFTQKMMLVPRSLIPGFKFYHAFSNAARTTFFGKSSNSIFRNTISLSSNKEFAVKFFQSKPSWNFASNAPPKRWKEDTPSTIKEATNSKKIDVSERMETILVKEPTSHPQAQLHAEIEQDSRYAHQFDEQFSSPRITVLGIGGAGSNALNTMIDSNLSGKFPKKIVIKILGVEFIVANTDAQALGMSKAHKKFQLGKKVTRGLGAGAKPHMGKEAAKESLDELMREIGNSHMLFLTAGMGGGTGTGACPIIAEAARTHGILTVGIVTTPFHFEGKRRMQIAEEGIRELEKCLNSSNIFFILSAVDTLIVIPNQKLLFLEDKQKHTWMNSFKMVDNVLLNGIRTVTDLLVIPGEINLDFADVNTVMKGMGRALLGTGEAEGHGRSKMAAVTALHNPLLEDMPVKGAKGVLINIYGGNDLGLGEVEEISNTIHESVDPDANIIFGTSYDEKLTGKVRVSLIVTGMTKNESNPKKETPTPQPKQANTASKSTEKGKEEKPEKKSSFLDTLKKYW